MPNAQESYTLVTSLFDASKGYLEKHKNDADIKDAVMDVVMALSYVLVNVCKTFGFSAVDVVQRSETSFDKAKEMDDPKKNNLTN